MSEVGITIVGGGVVGLAIAARLARSHRDVVLLERRERYGQETSSRNSEVIHAGMYYPTGSLKARLCVEGCHKLYEIAERHNVPHRRCGKIITATEAAELPALDRILRTGEANGVLLQPLTATAARALEPHVRTEGALLSPNTGVISAHGLMDCLAHLAREAGATILTRSEVVGLSHRVGGYEVEIETPEGRDRFTSERVVNAAGLDADTVAGLAGIDVRAVGYALHYCKGSYFSVSGRYSRALTRLVYPVPDEVSLGVHALVDLAGRLRFGPDVEFLDPRRQDYTVDESKRAAFARSVRRLVPEIRDEDLSPDTSGIRPKLQGPGEPWRDFVIREESDRGLPGFIDLIGIDSPGLTSSPAIADYVAALLA